MFAVFNQTNVVINEIVFAFANSLWILSINVVQFECRCFERTKQNEYRPKLSLTIFQHSDCSFVRLQKVEWILVIKEICESAKMNSQNVFPVLGLIFQYSSPDRSQAKHLIVNETSSHCCSYIHKYLYQPIRLIGVSLFRVWLGFSLWITDVFAEITLFQREGFKRTNLHI